jgi:hypothetical protein
VWPEADELSDATVRHTDRRHGRPERLGVRLGPLRRAVVGVSVTGGSSVRCGGRGAVGRLGTAERPNNDGPLEP